MKVLFTLLMGLFFLGLECNAQIPSFKNKLKEKKDVLKNKATNKTSDMKEKTNVGDNLKSKWENGDPKDMAKKAGRALKDGPDLQAANLLKNTSLLHEKMITKYFVNMTEQQKAKFLKTFSFNSNALHSFSARYVNEEPSYSKVGLRSSLSTKGLLLKSSIEMRKAVEESGDPELLKQYDDWQEQQRQVYRYSQMDNREREAQGIDLDKEEKKAKSMERKISSKSKKFREKRSLDTTGFEQILATLKPGEAAMEMVRFPLYKRMGYVDTICYGAYLIKYGSSYPIYIVNKNGKDLEEKYIRFYKKGIKGGQLDLKGNFYSEEFAARLYDNFWKQFEPHMSGVKTLYFSPDGVYNQMSPTTLPNPSTKKYVGEGLDIIQLTNCRDLLVDHSLKETKDALIVGNPDFDMKIDPKTSPKDTSNKAKTDMTALKNSMTITELPGTKGETDRIHALLEEKGFSSTLIQETKATEGALKEVKNPKIAHIATHGFFLEYKEDPPEDMAEEGEGTRGGNKMSDIETTENPLMRSGLLLAGVEHTVNNPDFIEPHNDGILTAYEAMHLNLVRTDIVVLSACETGLGEVKNGEGVYGLQRAFMVAGAKNLLFSLWTVSDEATQLLMTTFYEKWLNGTPKRQAFSEAQAAVREKYSSPYYWGAFVMLGK